MKDTEKKPSKQDLAHADLDALYILLKGKNSDQVHKELGIERMHFHLIIELGERKEKKRGLYFSDGNCELLSGLRKKLKV